MKYLLLLSLLTANLHAATAVKDFGDLIGRRSPQKIFNELLEHNQIVLIKCLSTFCLRCKRVEKGFEKLASTYQGKVLCIDMNVQKFDDITDQFNLKSVATFLLYVHGHLYKKIRGSGKLDQVAQFVSSTVKKLS